MAGKFYTTKSCITCAVHEKLCGGGGGGTKEGCRKKCSEGKRMLGDISVDSE
jgi:hypothetical protein